MSLCLLLWRNFTRRKRSRCATCVEIVFPILVVALFILIFNAFSEQHVPTRQYFGERQQVRSLAAIAHRLNVTDARIALGKHSSS